MFLIYLILIGLFGYLIGLWATKKGYAFWNWFFASSVIGFIVLACLSDATDAKLTDELKSDLVKKGNNIGMILSIVGVIFALFPLLSSVQ